jgi:hypothetical protein
MTGALPLCSMDLNFFQKFALSASLIKIQQNWIETQMPKHASKENWQNFT